MVCSFPIPLFLTRWSRIKIFCSDSITDLFFSTHLFLPDFHGAWDEKTGVNSPLYDQVSDPESGWSVDGCVKNWVALGAPQEKVNIGLGFYGRSFRGAKELGVAHGGTDDSSWEIDEGTPQYFVSNFSSIDHFFTHVPRLSLYCRIKTNHILFCAPFRISWIRSIKCLSTGTLKQEPLMLFSMTERVASCHTMTSNRFASRRNMLLEKISMGL